MADRSGSPERDRIAALDAAILRCLIGGGKDVGHEQHLLIGQATRDLEWTGIGEGDADVLRLAPGVAAEHMGIAEEA